MDINSEESSSISDADPQLVIDSLKDMDDLDAELFGNKKKQNLREPKKEEKTKTEVKPKVKPEGRKVTFQTSISHDGDDFDLDDPLAGLLSDADSNFSDDKKDFQKKPTKTFTSTPAASKASKKKKDNDDVVFDDDNDDLLMALDDDRTGQSTTSKALKNKPNDRLPPTKSQDISSKKQTAASKSKYRFDKDGNLVLDQPSTPIVEDVSFGTYQPSTTGKPQRSLGTARRPSPVPRQTEDDFLNFLTNEMETHTKPRGGKGAAPVKPDQPTARPTYGQKPTSRPRDFLGLGEEVDLGLDDHSSPLPSVAANAPPTFKTTEPATSKTKDKPTTPSSTIRKNITSPVIPQHPPTPLDSPPSPIKTKPTSPLFQSRDEADLFNFDEPLKPTSPFSRSPPSRRPLSSTLPQPLPNDKRLPQTTTALGTVETPLVGDHNSKIELLEAQLNHARKLLHEAQLGYQADMDLTMETYDSRVQALQGSINDMKLRCDREVESIKESYNVRLDAVRNQIRHHFDEVSERDSIEHEEIKRLRALHLTALEDTRLDYDHQIKRLKEAHVKDMDALKASTVYVRNLESMMQKVDSTSEQLAKLSSKYEVSLHAMTDKWSGIGTQHQQFISAVQGRLDDMQRSNTEMQSNIQQTVSRLEGNISEMNRTFRDQQYQMQLEHTRLETAQTSLQHDRKSLLQQVAAERAEAMKAHKEAIDLRQGYEREARENDERLRHRDEEIRLSQRVLEEARSAETEQSSQRERERRRIESDLARQQAAQVEKSEKLSVLEARLIAQKEEFERRHAALVQTEQRLLDKEEKVKQREEEAKELEQRNARKVAESIQALQEAKRVEREHASRMSELHTEANEVAKQRQLLAEERKSLVEDRLAYQHLPNLSSSKHPQHELTPSKLINPERIRKPFTPNRSGSNTALWLFTAQKLLSSPRWRSWISPRTEKLQHWFNSRSVPLSNALQGQFSIERHQMDGIIPKDRDFLDDEEIFLETLKSPHGQQGAVES